MVQSAALSVINSHRSGQLLANSPSQSLPELHPPHHHHLHHHHHHHQPPHASHSPPLQQEVVDEMPAYSLHCSSPDSERDMVRTEKFLEVINAANTSLPELRKLSWSGIPSQYYGTRHEDIHQDTFRQIHIDIPRMSPLIPLFQQTIVQEMFERILYIWAIRHPASGYVQGINNLVTPFFIVFLHEVVPKEESLDTYEVEKIEAEQRAVVRQTASGPGIQSKVQQLSELMKRIDVNLHQHLARHEIDYLQFSFRWFNNLPMREMPLGCTVRLWDTLHAEPDGFSHFVLYVCAAFLTYFSQHLMNQRISDTEISLLVAEAFRLKYTFADAPNHLQTPRK
ncbi:hypothetical protein O3P69_013455 [Scylla paramamosain]|uniref:Rab-GAP TBC domain-containing protein n=1 Tax=Scylla paramamosain TaxID=85552 RepID=A0AAW0SAL5_SCYPA